MSKLIDRNSLEKLEYSKLGFKCGLEIHQQLNSGKLFCSCPCDIVPNATLDKEIFRRLRFSVGEGGGVDSAALAEFKKGKYNVYKFNDEIACLVDIDEEPPNGPNVNALNAVIGVSKMFNLKFFDKFQFMRKLIIDGSVTSGFQRTSMVGFGGHFETSDGRIEINGINLEEDSSRALERFEGYSVYSLDRQGIPLIEITTGPQIKSPSQALESAVYIGNVLRSFWQTRRGLGTIRQDLNVSIKGGARVEIKGTQNLKLIPEIIDNEIRRQKVLISIISELKERGIDSKNVLNCEICDVSKVFKETDSSVILKNLEIKNSGVFGIKLKGFSGILGYELQENFRFASEISDRNKKHFPMIKGLFHSDELPKYGITSEEVSGVRKELKIEENDGFILICNEKEIACESLKNVLSIISEMVSGLDEHVRQVDPKGVVTKFSRPMPGASRMYPETDINPIIVTEELIESVQLPELYSDKISRLVNEFGISENKLLEFLEKFDERQVRELITVSNKSASALYGVLFEVPKDIKKRDKIEPIDFKYELFVDLLKEVHASDLGQKAVRDIFVSLYKDNLSEVSNLKTYLDENNLISEPVDLEDVEIRVKKIVEGNPGAPFGGLMGMCMKEFGGTVDGKVISSVLKRVMK